jgi:ADP-heptose:LPS heptosyltransferase
LENFDAVDNVLSVSKDFRERLRLAGKIRKTKYDVAFNLHGGTTAGFFVRASGAKYRVGYEDYQYNFLYNRKLSSAKDFWKQEKTHSAEQQLALLGFVGVPVEDKPKTHLTLDKKALNSIESKIQNPKSKIALIHPVAAFDTKQWATENFARIADFLGERDFQIIAVATLKERAILENLEKLSKVSIKSFDALTLPEITALASQAKIFVGNDSGIAHIASAVKTPCVVIFGSSNRDHWRPWTDAPHEIVFEELACQPCAGYLCKEFDQPKCIRSVKTESVIQAIEKVFKQNRD